MRHLINLLILLFFSSWAAVPVMSASIPIENASFEAPVIDPDAFPAWPYIDGWTEIDVDPEGLSRNTGVFPNTEPNSFDHIVNADGDQLAFLFSEAGNALEQRLSAVYKAGCDYTLTVAVGVSSRRPPTALEPVGTIELALYYHDVNEIIDIVSETIDATGFSPTRLQDFSLYVPAVLSGDSWVDKSIGVAIRATGVPGGVWVLDNVRLIESAPVLIPIANASFEAPVVDPNGFGAVPLVDGWTEVDIDTLFSTNTGVFANTEPGSFDHIVNADGGQLAFLGSQTGNALEQDLEAVYKAGYSYCLIVGVGVSGRFPPSAVEPVDALELVFYYRDANDVIDIAHRTVEAAGQSYTKLQDFSLELAAVRSGDAWAGRTIGIALRAAGRPGGFWDMDNVRLIESAPVLIDIENASFEFPVVDPNGFPAVPYVDGWTEIDIDTLASPNTGVFANTDVNSWDHKGNADGRQLAFMGSEQGNALEQDLAATYKVGCNYRLTVAVGGSWRFPPSVDVPVDTLELALFYRDGADIVDIVSHTVNATDLSVTLLTDFSLYLPTVQPDDTWAGKAIGISLRAAGRPGGFWDLDNVRLAESLPDPDIASKIKD